MSGRNAIYLTLADRVRLIPHGVDGPLRWRDDEERVEFVIPMSDGRP